MCASSEVSTNNFRARDEEVSLSSNCSGLFWNQVCTYNTIRKRYKVSNTKKITEFG